MSEEVEGKGQKETKFNLRASRGGLAEVAKEYKWQEKKLTFFAATVLKPPFEMITMGRFSRKEKQENDNPLLPTESRHSLHAKLTLSILLFTNSLYNWDF